MPSWPKNAPSSTDEKVEREDGASKGRYRMVIDGVEAEMTYSRAGEGLIIIDHTEVPAALRGRKVGERMVRQARAAALIEAAITAARDIGIPAAVVEATGNLRAFQRTDDAPFLTVDVAVDKA